jgi:CHC2 zinc finger
MSSIDYAAIKNRVSIESFCRSRGIALSSHGSYLAGRCPLHNEASGQSFAVFPRIRQWRCFGACDRHGDVVDLEAALSGASIAEAARRLEQEAHIFAEQQYTFCREEGEQEKKPPRPVYDWRADLRRGTPSELRALAELRSLSLEAVEIADDRGLLQFRSTRECLAWVLTDSSLQQAVERRADGQLWSVGSKAKLLPGCSGRSPIGLAESALFPTIAVVEGGPDLLGALHHAYCDNTEQRLGVVAMSNKNTEFSPADAAQLAGKRVRIFPHADLCGAEVALKWSNQLQGTVDSLDLWLIPRLTTIDGPLSKDLCDLAHLDVDAWEAHRSSIERLTVFLKGQQPCTQFPPKSLPG